MPPRSDKACDVVVVEAIKGAHFHVGRNLRHKCNIAASAMKATPTPGSRINDYNNYVSNGDLPTKFLLNSNEIYGLCSNMKQKIDDALKKRDREAAAAANNTNAAIRDPPPGGGVTAAGNNNTNTTDPPGVGGVVMLPRTTNMVVKQEAAAAEIAATTGESHDRRMVYDYNNTNAADTLAAAAAAASTNHGVTAANNNTNADTVAETTDTTSVTSAASTSKQRCNNNNNNTSASTSTRKASSSSTRNTTNTTNNNTTNTTNTTSASAASSLSSTRKSSRRRRKRCNNNNNSTVDTVTEAASSPSPSPSPYSPSNPRTSTQEKLLKDVKEANKQQSNKKPFHEYQHRGDSIRADIIRSFGVQIMAACSYSKLLNESGIDYIEKDCEFKMDCSVLLEEIATFVGNKVKQNFSCTNFDNSLRYLPPGESLDAGTLVDRDIETISSLISDERTSHLLHCGLSDSSYNNVKSLVEERVGKHIKLLTPYMLRKGRLPMETQFLQNPNCRRN